MNVRLEAKLLRAVPKVERIPRTPVQLSPIPWGKRDPMLARGVCRHIADAMPKTTVPFVRGLDRKLRAFLSHYGIRA